MLIIFGSLVLLILLAIFIPVILMIRKTRQQQHERDWLQQHGTRITAYVKYVILQGGDSETRSETRSDLLQGANLVLDVLDDASPRQIAYDQRMLSPDRPSSSRPLRYQITAEWLHPRTHETYTFQQTVYSGALPKDCDPLKLSQLSVLIDPDNPKRYCMEFDTASYNPLHP